MIVFYHIPKTAGISMAHAAARAIPGIHRRVLLTEMRTWLIELERGTADIGDITFLAGHFGYGVHKRLPGAPETLTFIRHPVEHTVSLHYEAARRPDIYPYGDLRTLLSTRAGEPYFGNTQVRHLAAEDGRPVVGPVSGRHLARAKEVLTTEISCFGITEYFSASLALINERLDTRMSVRYDNVSTTRVFAADLDPHLLCAIWDANALDLELYDHGRTIFLERLRAAQCKPAAHP